MYVTGKQLREWTILAGAGESETLKTLLNGLRDDGKIVVTDHAEQVGKYATFHGKQDS